MKIMRDWYESKTSKKDSDLGQETKKSSPTLSDPAMEEDRNLLFPKPDNNNSSTKDSDITPTQSTILKKPSSSDNLESPQSIGTESSSPVSSYGPMGKSDLQQILLH
jgi:hypothetical protein